MRKVKIRKIVVQIGVFINCIIFRVRKFIFGFENANAMLRKLDKHSMIPILRQNGAQIGERCDIEAPLLFHNCANGCFDNLKIGNDCHIGKNCFIELRDQIIIEDNVTVAMQTTLITHLDVGKSELQQFYPTNSAKIVVKSHAYIGACSTILNGVKIGTHSLIAAGSVVNKSVAPYSLVGGTPARFIKNIKESGCSIEKYLIETVEFK